MHFRIRFKLDLRRSVADIGEAKLHLASKRKISLVCL